MKILILLIFGIIAFSVATDDQVTELPTPIPIVGAKLMAPHGLAKRETVPSAPVEKSSSSSESSEEKGGKIRDPKLIASTDVTPIGVIKDKGIPVVEGDDGIIRERRDEALTTETQKSENIGADVKQVKEIPAQDAPKIVAKRSDDFQEPVTEPPKGAVTPEGVEKDDGLPEIGLGSRRKRDSDSDVGDANYPVTDPPKSAVTPQGVEEDDGLPDLGLGSRKKRDNEEEFREPVTEPPKAAVTPEGVEKDDGLPEIGFGTRRKRDDQEGADVGDANYPVTDPPKSAVTPQGVEEDDGLPDLGLGSRKRRETDYAPNRARRYA